MNRIILRTMLSIFTSEGVTDTIWLANGHETLIEYLVGELDYPLDIKEGLLAGEPEVTILIDKLLADIKGGL